jgi:hypothetical protein
MGEVQSGRSPMLTFNAVGLTPLSESKQRSIGSIIRLRWFAGSERGSVSDEYLSIQYARSSVGPEVPSTWIRVVG